MTNSVLETIPDKKTNTCTFVFSEDIFPEGEDEVFFSENVYKQIRQGLVKARLNYNILELEATVLEENEEENTVTVKISAV